eukprot:augustus_masked-scaffold_9-processed-gene-5.10-mRNA-1 protein AED:1.00 eAED:1.00 QI:0/-1/0/0/-1/1/1/0/432
MGCGNSSVRIKSSMEFTIEESNQETGSEKTVQEFKEDFKTFMGKPNLNSRMSSMLARINIMTLSNKQYNSLLSPDTRDVVAKNRYMNIRTLEHSRVLLNYPKYVSSGKSFAPNYKRASSLSDQSSGSSITKSYIEDVLGANGSLSLPEITKTTDYINANYITTRRLLTSEVFCELGIEDFTMKSAFKNFMRVAEEKPQEVQKWFKKEAEYIATQGPLKRAFFDFWSMVWDEKSYVILMLSDFFENKMDKVDKYFPLEAGEELIILPSEENKEISFYFKVTCHLKEDLTDFKATKRIVQVEKIQTIKKEEKIVGVRTLTHIFFRDWPDFLSVAENKTTLKLIRFYNAEESSLKQAVEESEFGPSIVHCSAGVGRTGTFMLLRNIINEWENKKPFGINVFSLVLQLRLQRANLVITAEQLKMIYMVLQEWMFEN